jgi:sugar phosphate isomerase/epimerase
MKLSCLPVSYFNKIISGEMSIISWIREASSIGLNGADLSTHFFKERSLNRLTEIRKAYESSNMILPLLNTYPQLLHPITEMRRDEINQLKEDIKLAKNLGAENIRLVSGQWFPEVTRTEGLQRTINGLKEVSEAALKYGVGLVYENHSQPSNWIYPDYAFNPENFLKIYEQLKTTNIKILFDTANPIAYGIDPLPLLKEVFDRVSCIHIADSSVRGKLVPSVIGKGLVSFPEIFSYLKEKEYAGWLSIEEASNTGSSGIKTACEFVMDFNEN